jgi:polysaccharide deacetylase 2 family uncharacterized protein YibQ
VLLVIAGVFIFLEYVKNDFEGKQVVHVVPMEKQQVPPPVEPVYPHDVYTSAQRPSVAPHPKTLKAFRQGTMAVIIDDMGASMKDAEKLLSINLPMTFAIIPGLSHSRDIAEIARVKGRGVIIHMPMEPRGYPQQRLEKNGLLLSQSTEEISGRVKKYFLEIPEASGANNHMGSAFTEREDKMSPVMDVLKQQGKFFIDSRTSAKSVAYSLAVRRGVKAGTRNIFLDNDQDVDMIKAQLKLAAVAAAKRGGVIAICHPHPPTIQALQEMLPALQREGITFVSAAQMVR